MSKSGRPWTHSGVDISKKSAARQKQKKRKQSLCLFHEKTRNLGPLWLQGLTKNGLDLETKSPKSFIQCNYYINDELTDCQVVINSGHAICMIQKCSNLTQLFPIQPGKIFPTFCQHKLSRHICITLCFSGKVFISLDTIIPPKERPHDQYAIPNSPPNFGKNSVIVSPIDQSAIAQEKLRFCAEREPSKLSESLLLAGVTFLCKIYFNFTQKMFANF